MPQVETPPQDTPQQQLLKSYHVDAGEAFAVQVDGPSDNVQITEPKKRPTPIQDPVTKKFVSQAKAAEMGLIDPPQQQTEQQQGFTHPRSVIRQGRILGLTDEEMAGTPGDDLAEYIADQMVEMRAQAGRPSNNNFQTNDAPVERAPAPPKEPDFFDGLTLGEDQGEPVKFGDLHPAYQRTLREIHKNYKGELDSLKAQVAALTHNADSRARKEVFTEFDQVFNQHPEFFGHGATDSMKPGKTLQRRKHAEIRLKELLAANQHTTPRADCERVVDELFGLGPPQQQPQFAEDDYEPTPEPEFTPRPTNNPRINGQQVQQNGNPRRQFGRPVQQRGNQFANQQQQVDDDQIPPADFYANTVQRPTNRNTPMEPPGPNRMAQQLDRLMREQNVGEYDNRTPRGFLP